MKRIISFIVILSMMLLAIGCTKTSEEPNNLDFVPEQNNAEQDEIATSEYQALVFAYSDSALQIPLKTEISFDSYEHYEEEARKNQTKEFQLCGISYQATYVETSTFTYDLMPRHFYNGEKSGFSVYDDGTLAMAYRIDPYLGMENVENECSEEQCLQNAKVFFEETFDSIEDYRIEPKHLNDMVNQYEFRFIKVVDSWRTTEEIVVWVSDVTGDIIGFRRRMPERFSVANTVEFEQQKVQETVISRLNEFCESVADPYDKVEYEKLEYLLTKTEDGKYAIICEAEVRCYQGGASFGDIIKFLVTKV